MEYHGSLLSVGANWSDISFDPSLLDRELTITALHDPPYLFIHDHHNGSFAFSGYLYDIWTIVARELNLRYRIQPLRTGGFGSMNENGTWIGLVGELAYKRADIALTWIALRKDRVQVIDYIDAVPVEQDQYTFYVRQGSGGIPPLSVGMFSALLKPLHLHVWWVLLVSLLVLSVVLRFSLRCNRRAESKQTVEEMSWGSCLLSSFMSVVGQGWASTPDSLAARTVTISCWMLGILIYANYTANLISYLTVVAVDKPINSLKEFTERSNWRFAVERGIGELNDWKLSSSPYERELYRRSEKNDKFIALDISGPTAAEPLKPNVLTYIDVNRIFFSQGSKACNLVPLLDTLPPKKNAYMGIAKDRDGLRQAINGVMQILKQVGTISRLKTMWLPSGQDMCDNSASFKELSFGDLLAVLVVVPLAVLVSGAIFFGEMVWYRLRGRCQISDVREPWAASAGQKKEKLPQYWFT